MFRPNEVIIGLDFRTY